MNDRNNVLSTKTEGHALWITINRPNVRNAINFQVMEELEKKVSMVEKDQNIRVLVLKGSGNRSFISGGDLSSFHQLKTMDEAESMARRMQQILERIEKLPCWTIACINGDAYGGGCEIALAFDFRISFPAVTLGFTQSKFNLPPGWGGLTRLIAQVGRSKALMWLASAEKVSGQKAYDHNFLDELTPHPELERRCMAWAKELSYNDRDFISNLKEKAFNYEHHRWQSIEDETEEFAHFWAQPEHFKRVENFVERKKR